jgi:hypothetical protein
MDCSSLAKKLKAAFGREMRFGMAQYWGDLKSHQLLNHFVIFIPDRCVCPDLF